MPEMTPVADHIIAPDPSKGLSLLSDIISVRQQKQALQTGQYTQQSALAAAQQAQIEAKAQTDANDFFKQVDFHKHLAADGTTDIDSMLSDPMAQRLSGAGKALVVNKLQDIKQKQIGTAKGLMEMGETGLDLIGRVTGAIATDPDVVAGNENGKAKVRSALQSAIDMGGPPVAKALSPYMAMTNGALKQGELPIRLKALQMQGMTAQNALTAQTPQPQFVQGEGGLVPVNVNANAPQAVGAPMGQTVPNATSPTTYVDAAGQIHYLAPGGAPPSASNAPRRTPGPSSGSSLGSNPTNYAVAAVADAVKAGNELTNASRTNDRDYGTNVHISNVIRQLSKDTKTGPGTEMFHHMLAGSIKGLGQDAGADYQVIGSMLDRQAAMAQAAMGLPETNAGLQTSQSLSGSTQFAPEALQTKNNLTQALVEGAHQFRHGLDRVAGFEPITDKASAGKVRKFQAEWTDNFDPNAYRLWNAHQTNDADEIARLRKELSATEFKSLGQKMRNLKSLSETGHLPQ